MSKIYELTTNGKGGWGKYLVRDVKDDEEARVLAKKVFGEYYWDGGISYYDDTETRRTKSMTKEQFVKLRNQFQH